MKKFLGLALVFSLGLLGACGNATAKNSNEDANLELQSESSLTSEIDETTETIYSCGDNTATYVYYEIEQEEFDINDVEITVYFGRTYSGQRNPYSWGEGKEEWDAGMIGNKVHVSLANWDKYAEDGMIENYHGEGKSIAWYYEDVYQGMHQEYMQILKKISMEDFYSYKYAVQENEKSQVVGFNYSEKMKISPEIFTGERGELALSFDMICYKSRVLESGERITSAATSFGTFQTRYFEYERLGDKIKLIPSDKLVTSFHTDAPIYQQLNEQFYGAL